MDENVKQQLAKAALEYAKPEVKHYGQVVASHPRQACTGAELQDNGATLQRHNARQLLDAKIDEFLTNPALNHIGTFNTAAPKKLSDDNSGYKLKHDIIGEIEQKATAQVVPHIKKAKGCESVRSS